MKPISRRAVLRGAGAAVALPALEAMEGQAQAQAAPKRFGVWYFGGGVVNTGFYPSATGPGWTPTPMLEPLGPHRDYVTVVSGTDMKAGGKAHNSHRAYSVCNSWYDRGDSYGDPKHASVDQIVADAWNGQTRLRSLEVGVSRNQTYYTSSYRAGGAPVAPETNPQRVFDRLFGSGVPTTGGATTKPLLMSHQSVLDATKNDATRLMQRLGQADRTRVDAHLQAIRDIERQLGSAAKPAATASKCSKPDQPTSTGTGTAGMEDLEGVNKVMSDLLVAGLACDVVRVFNFRFTSAQAMTIFWQVGSHSEYHPITHGEQGGGYDAWGPKIVTFTMKQLAYLVDRLKNTPEGTGNLLDATLMYVTTEFMYAPSHSFNNHPMLLVGRGGGSVRAGQHIRAPGDNQAKVPMACLKAMGVNVAGFGAPDKPCYATAPLAGILT
jgi:hypothetical protein